MKKDDRLIQLMKASPDSLTEFKAALQSSFSAAVESDLGQPLDEPIPSDDEIEHSIAADGAVAYWIIANDVRVGGAVVLIDDTTKRNSLSFFFISTNQQSRGLGLEAWKAIEREYPDTQVWETVTPYFEKRNIHFYVNRCGFKIVEFYNKFNPDPNQTSNPAHQDEGDDEMFRFIKVMGTDIE